MSHHLDSPASRRDPRLNVTDVYAFDGDDATVLTMIVNSSLAGAGRVPGFHPEGRYEFKIHLDGAAAEQLTYRFSFTPADASGAQRVAIDRLAGPDAGDDRAAGARVAEGDAAAAISGSGVRAWCGAAADPFYLDLHQLTHILEGLQHEQPIEAGEWTPAQAPAPSPARRSAPSSWRSQTATRSCGRAGAFVTAAVRRTGISDPDGYGRDVAARLLPDVLPYQVGTAAAFSFAGFNGRALADNAPEVMYGLVTNSAVPTGLVAAAASETRQDKFPYVVPA